MTRKTGMTTMEKEKIDKLASDLAKKWYDDDYGGWSWKTANEVVEEFILWLYKNGGSIYSAKSNV